MRVESVDKIDNDRLSVDCSVTQLRVVETALYQSPRRTTWNAPLRKVQQVQGQQGVRSVASDCSERRTEERQTQSQRMQR